MNRGAAASAASYDRALDMAANEMVPLSTHFAQVDAAEKPGIGLIVNKK